MEAQLEGIQYKFMQEAAKEVKRLQKCGSK